MNALAAESLAAEVNPAEVGGLPTQALAQQLGMNVEEVDRDLQALADLGLVGVMNVNMDDSPIGDADTDPKRWLFAGQMFEPIAAAHCYPLVFMTILNDAAEATPNAPLSSLGIGDEELAFVANHAGAHELHGAAQFLAAEIGGQLLTRINERYPVGRGYSPLHIAQTTLYHAIRDAHDEQESSRE